MTKLFKTLRVFFAIIAVLWITLPLWDEIYIAAVDAFVPVPAGWEVAR